MSKKERRNLESPGPDLSENFQQVRDLFCRLSDVTVRNDMFKEWIVRLRALVPYASYLQMTLMEPLQITNSFAMPSIHIERIQVQPFLRSRRINPVNHVFLGYFDLGVKQGSRGLQAGKCCRSYFA